MRAALTFVLALSMYGAALAPDGRTEGQQHRAAHPNWLLPAWTADGPSVWTEVGAPYAASVALIGPDGSFAPRNHGPAVSFWIYDVDAAHLIDPTEHPARLRLEAGYLPIVTSAWDAADLHVETTYFSALPGGDPATWFADQSGVSQAQTVTFVRLTVSTSSTERRRLAAFVALRPFGIERDMHPIAIASCDAASASLVADGQVVLTGLQPATSCGASALSTPDGDVSTVAARNQVPRPTVFADLGERSEALLRLELTAAPGSPGVLEFRAPAVRATPGTALPLASFDVERGRTAAAWRTELTRTTFDVSDDRFTNAFKASQAYLLLNRRGPTPRSGPLAHDAFWVRDAAYIGQALERVGYGAENRATLEAMLQTQREDGSFPAITDPAGPRSVDEWDAPGEAIGALVAHYRFGHDRAWLARVYPSIARAARFLDALRGRTLLEDPETRSLLPANLSAEDLGSATWHHYWDDFWAIAGYREAAFVASELAQSADATDFASRADDLQSTVLASVALVQARTERRVIPNGPEDPDSSAMARGTTPALWPIRSLQGGLARDQLRSSFRYYHQTWMEPQGGGYRHVENTLWPYGGLGIAHAMLRLGLLAPTWQVLDWTIEHQTLPGTFAWGEAISPRTGGLELGDMPHSWAAAELISLLRDLVVVEQSGVLAVNSGLPDQWLAPGKHVLLQNAPTEYGSVTISMTRAANLPSDLTIQLEGAAPGGWQLRVPGIPIAVSVDGSTTVAPSDQLQLSGGSHTVVVRYTR